MLRVLMVVAVMVGCSRKDNGETHNIAYYQQWRDVVCQEFNPATITRCDRATFHVLMNTMCGFPIPTVYEFPAGKWNRDLEPCYPENSSSETSFDTYLSVVMSRDSDAIQRVIDYAKPRKWETGNPAGGVGNITPLIPLLRVYLQGQQSPTYDLIGGHRGHLIAGYLWEWANQHDGLLPVETEVLHQLHNNTPKSPYFSCLYRRFSGKDQKHTLDLLENIGHSNFGWGSSSWEVHLALTLGCLEGR